MSSSFFRQDDSDGDSFGEPRIQHHPWRRRRKFNSTTAGRINSRRQLNVYGKNDTSNDSISSSTAGRLRGSTGFGGGSSDDAVDSDEDGGAATAKVGQYFEHSKYDRRERRRSFGSDVGLASDDDDLYFDGTPQRTPSTTDDDTSEDPKDAAVSEPHPSLLSLPRVVGEQAEFGTSKEDGSLEDDEDDVNSDRNWKMKSSDEEDEDVDVDEDNKDKDMEEEGTERFHQVGTIGKNDQEGGKTDPEQTQSEEGQENTEREDDALGDGFVTVSKDFVTMSKGMADTAPPSAAKDLKPKFSWEKVRFDRHGVLF